MSHSAPTPPNRRRFELAAGLLALGIGVLIAVLAFVALSQPKGRQAAKTTIPASSTSSASAPATTSSKPAATPTTTKPASPPTTTKPVSTRPAVIVLNNSGAPGLAATAVGRLTRGGWTATNGGNFSGDILSTVAYYDPNVTGAQSAATALQAQFPAIKRVKARFDGLPQGPIILVLTSDYS